MSGYKSRVKQSSTVGALVLLPPIVLILSLMILPAGCGGGGGAAAPTATQGVVQVSFTDSPSAGFQSVLLNVIAVRLNPSMDGNVAENDPNWVEISAPPGTGTPTPLPTGAVSELQIDLNQLQNDAKFFNSGVVPSNNYYQIEVIVDSQNPGTIVPTCGGSGVEGCIPYPMTFAPGSNLKLNLAATNSQISVTDNSFVPLVIDFSAGTPTFSSGNYTVTPQISIPPSANFVGTVVGTVKGTVNTGLTVNAELSGTNTIIATATVVNSSATNSGCPSGSNGCFTLNLPAAQNGTAYDFYLSGGSVNFSPVSNQMIIRGSNSLALTATSQSSSGSVTGAVVTQQFRSPIQSATVELLEQSTNDASTSVVVASTTTDELGNYSLPSIPAGTYTAIVLQSGFDPLTNQVTVSSSGITCVASPSSTPTPAASSTPTPTATPTAVCNFPLTNTAISGTVTLDAPASRDLEVMVMAEDFGSVNVENFTTVTIPKTLMQAPFTIMVPSLVPSFDLIASTQDSFEGGTPSSFTAHSIAVLSNVDGGASGISLGVLSCLGHGSISGIAQTFDPGTTVRLFKNDINGASVALAETQVAPVQAPVPSGTPTATAGEFSFCVPPDKYQIQRFENGSPATSPTSVGTMAAPMPTGTPCPICGSAPTCPGLCNNTALSGSL